MSNSNKTEEFLNELRDLLDKYKARILTPTELELEGIGYIGLLEDNIDILEVYADGDGIMPVFKSKKTG